MAICWLLVQLPAGRQPLVPATSEMPSRLAICCWSADVQFPALRQVRELPALLDEAAGLTPLWLLFRLAPLPDEQPAMSPTAPAVMINPAMIFILDSPRH
jgi:hypothetical protein